MKHKILKYYEGSITWEEIETELTIPDILELNRSAVRIEAENKREIEKQMRNKGK